jgi:hypothetical protein
MPKTMNIYKLTPKIIKPHQTCNGIIVSAMTEDRAVATINIIDPWLLKDWGNQCTIEILGTSSFGSECVLFKGGGF